MNVVCTDVKNHILEMAKEVEAMIESVLKFTPANSIAEAGEVEEQERKINEHHIENDNLCFKYMALKRPAAHDLRLALASMKINSELERIADEIYHIHRYRHVIKKEIFQNQLPMFLDMVSEVKLMFQNAMSAFEKEDRILAMDVMRREPMVDDLNRNLIKFFIGLEKNPYHFEECMSVLKISKNLERIGDNITNIAEDVIFLESGIDIRHRHYDRLEKGNE